MINIIILFCLYLPFTARADCSRLNLSSCWDLLNRSLREIKLSCHDETTDLFGVQKLPVGATYEQQFPPDLNYGRGAFGPDVQITCKVTRFKTVRFALLGSGDRVGIAVESQRVLVVVRSYWMRGVVNYTALKDRASNTERHFCRCSFLF